MSTLRSCTYKTNVLIGDKWTPTEEKEGLFHQWGTVPEVYEGSTVAVTIAIVEDAKTGQAEIAPISWVKFKNLTMKVVPSAVPNSVSVQ